MFSSCSGPFKIGSNRSVQDVWRTLAPYPSLANARRRLTLRRRAGAIYKSRVSPASLHSRARCGVKITKATHIQIPSQDRMVFWPSCTLGTSQRWLNNHHHAKTTLEIGGVAAMSGYYQTVLMYPS